MGCNRVPKAPFYGQTNTGSQELLLDLILLELLVLQAAGAGQATGTTGDITGLAAARATPGLNGRPATSCDQLFGCRAVSRLVAGFGHVFLGSDALQQMVLWALGRKLSRT